MNTRTITLAEWRAEGERLFGADEMAWRFVCPVCHHVQTPADYKAAGAPSGAAGFSCVGRWTAGAKEACAQGSGGPCTYAGGGLFQLNPVEVSLPDGGSILAFEFAPAAEGPAGTAA